MENEQALRVLTLDAWFDGGNKRERLRAIALEIESKKPHIVMLQGLIFFDGVKVDEGELGQALDELCKTTSLKVAQHNPAKIPGVLLSSGLITLTSLDVISEGREEVLPDVSCCGQVTPFTTVWLRSPAGRPVLAVNTSFPRGLAEEPHRSLQAPALDYAVRREVRRLSSKGLSGSPVVVLAGDLHASPTSDTLRYLTGEGAGPLGARGTFWLDSWALAGQGDGFTTSPSNPNARSGGKGYENCNTARFPASRKTFILVYGPVYGRPGQPLNAELVLDTPCLVGGKEEYVSDTFGIMASLWDPPEAL